MGQTLRRSCAACAKSKLGCDLQTPRCSRCEKRNIQCAYANEPLTRTSVVFNQHPNRALHLLEPSNSPLASIQSFDPFDLYPHTRLPRDRVQRLIHSFLHKIAFQYYPLDMNTDSNPFLVSWWPLALSDPALFHVSLQTACLDEELLAQKGFKMSELLMADSVSLLRRKVQDRSLAIQDGTMNSVITLAAIEFGKGNLEVSRLHVNGVKRLVELRGGISAVRQTNPLTARMVSWVSMLIMQRPQFEAQDDIGTGNGIPPISEWQSDPTTSDEVLSLYDFDIDPAIGNAFMRLRSVFQQACRSPLPPTRLHDLACFVIHRLLSPNLSAETAELSPMSESLRCGLALYMFIVQGPTYYSHAVILHDITTRFLSHLKQCQATLGLYDSIDTWFVSIGLVASTGTPHYEWFMHQARTVAVSLQITLWEDIFRKIKDILWLDTPEGEATFRPHWDAIFATGGVEELLNQGSI